MTSQSNDHVSLLRGSADFIDQIVAETVLSGKIIEGIETLDDADNNTFQIKFRDGSRLLLEVDWVYRADFYEAKL